MKSLRLKHTRRQFKQRIKDSQETRISNQTQHGKHTSPRTPQLGIEYFNIQPRGYGECLRAGFAWYRRRFVLYDVLQPPARCSRNGRSHVSHHRFGQRISPSTPTPAADVSRTHSHLLNHPLPRAITRKQRKRKQGAYMRLNWKNRLSKPQKSHSHTCYRSVMKRPTMTSRILRLFVGDGFSQNSLTWRTYETT